MSDFDIEFSHVGLLVFDLDKMVEFYAGVLGFPVTDRGLLHNKIPIAFLSRDPREHHQIALVQARPEEAIISTVNQISFRLPNLDELKRLQGHFLSVGHTQFRTAMHGTALSFYVFDPEGNQLELFIDTPWYIPQPCNPEFDLSLRTNEIWEMTEKFCREQPGFKPADQWRAEFAAQLSKGSAVAHA